MESKHLLSRQWIQYGALSGIIANLLFPLLILTSIPNYLEVFLAGLFGILFSIMGFALHHLLKQERQTILTQLGALFIFCGGIMFNLMIMVQLTFRGYLSNFREETSEAVELELLDRIGQTVDPVHLGIQLSIDFFTAIGMMLFSLVMLRSKYFGKILGVSGLLISISLIIVKCYAFPKTPYEIGIPYVFGPLIALWFLIVCIICLKNLDYNQ